MAFQLQPPSARDLFDVYLTQWPDVFLLKAVGKKASTDLLGERGAGIWWVVPGCGFLPKGTDS